MTETPSEVAQAPTAPPPAATNSFSRMAGVLFAPAETFAEIVRKPDILIPAIVIAVLALVSSIVLVPKLDFDSMMREQMSKSGRQMSEQDLDQAVKISSAFGKALGYAAPVTTLIMLVIVAGVLLLAFRLMGGEGTFKEAVSVTLYSWMPYVIAGIIMTIIAATRESITPDAMATLVRSNLGFLVDMGEQPVLFALLSSIDLFTVWTIVLLIIGFSYVGRVSRSKSAAIIITLWVVQIVFKLGFALLGSMGKAAA